MGNSPVVEYGGTGAYFLDKIRDGLWRLEVLPDAVFVSDPFGKASPRKEVTRIQWQKNRIQLMLAGLSVDFRIKGVNEGNANTATAAGTTFDILPGTYLIANTKTPAPENLYSFAIGTIAMPEFAAPKAVSTAPYIVHQPFQTVSAGEKF